MTNDHRLALSVFRRLLDSGVDFALEMIDGDMSLEIIGTAADVAGRQALIDGAVASAARDELIAGGMTAGDELDALALELAGGLCTTDLLED